MIEVKTTPDGIYEYFEDGNTVTAMRCDGGQINQEAKADLQQLFNGKSVVAVDGIGASLKKVVDLMNKFAPNS